MSKVDKNDIKFFKEACDKTYATSRNVDEKGIVQQQVDGKNVYPKTKPEAIELDGNMNLGLILGAILTYAEEWDHTNPSHRSGSVIKFNQEFFVALKETSLPPVDLILMEDGVIAKVDEHIYATKGSYDAVGNKEDWKKIPCDEMRLSSRYGTLNGEEVDVRTLATPEEVYQLEPYLYIDFVRGTINGMKFRELVKRIEAIEKKLGL